MIPANIDSADTGRANYERDLAKRPTYDDGTPRPEWKDLHPIAQWSWRRPTKLNETEPKKP